MTGGAGAAAVSAGMGRWLETAVLLRALLLGLFGAVAVAVEAAPVGIGAAALPSPDLLFCVVACWALRAPRATPVLLVYGLGLARDLLTDLPAGLGALALVAAAEALKARRAVLARQPFALEWLWVALVAAGMGLAQWLVVTVSLAQPPYLSMLLRQYAATVLVYPLVMLVLRWGIGIRAPRPERGRAPGARPR